MGGHGLFGGLFRALGLVSDAPKMEEAKTPEQTVADTANDQSALESEQNEKKRKANQQGLASNLLAGDTSATGIGRHSLLGD